MFQGQEKLSVLVGFAGLLLFERLRFLQGIIVLTVGKIEQKDLAAQIQILRIIGQGFLEEAHGISDIAAIQSEIAGEIITQHRFGRRLCLFRQIDNARPGGMRRRWLGIRCLAVP